MAGDSKNQADETSDGWWEAGEGILGNVRWSVRLNVPTFTRGGGSTSDSTRHSSYVNIDEWRGNDMGRAFSSTAVVSQPPEVRLRFHLNPCSGPGSAGRGDAYAAATTVHTAFRRVDKVYTWRSVMSCDEFRGRRGDTAVGPRRRRANQDEVIEHRIISSSARLAAIRGEDLSGKAWPRAYIGVLEPAWALSGTDCEIGEM
ncbi:hypothetical protein EJ04DRAFT_248534 [Polyplosphaeria fusca]|uniref:Uncharacterized protein n=1 Tax=Polyplosphaeria fusca TaxID=682080 RepID=A0A9P4QX27_9PLEO|nr:hypothetical protein EJ04DRAFT_248534 [Polyplosphaeria fusca]